MLFLQAALLASAPFVSPVTEQDNPSLVLSFGVYQSDKATEMYRKFTPILEALQVDLAARLDRDVEVELRIFRSYEEGLSALVSGDVDFVRFGPASYVLAKRRQKGLSLLAIEEKKGKTAFNGLIIARADSKLTSLKDLVGHAFAFGDQNSTIGRYLAQDELMRHGVHGADLKSFEFLGRHDKVLTSVLHGDHHAGALKESTYKKSKHKDEFKVLATFDNVTKPWIARADLDSDVREALSASLTECEDATVLDEFGVTGFVAGDDKLYAPIRAAMKRAMSFVPRPKHPQGK